MALHSVDHRPIPTTHQCHRYGKAGMVPPCRRVGILGAGETAMGIAQSLLEADIPVTVFDVARDTLDQATAAARSDYQKAVSAGALTAAQRDRRVALLAATINLHHLKDCDVIVDALHTDAAVKEGLFRRLNEVAKPGAVLMACTAHADATDLGRTVALMRFPENGVGMRLSDGASKWELVPANRTSERALATAQWVVQNLDTSRAAVA